MDLKIPIVSMLEFLRKERNETIWFYHKYKEYNGSQIAEMMNLARSNVHTIIKSMPENWESSWVKKKE